MLRGNLNINLNPYNEGDPLYIVYVSSHDTYI